MKNKRLWLLLLALLQLAAPLYIAWRWEDVLRGGEVYLFRTTPLDPGDVLRGRYVALGFKEREAPADADVRAGQEAYACLRRDAQGCAEVYRIAAARPADVPSVRVEVYAVYGGATARFQMPFSRYYVNEAEAPLLEERYAKRGEQMTAKVRVKDGYGVIEALEAPE